MGRNRDELGIEMISVNPPATLVDTAQARVAAEAAVKAAEDLLAAASKRRFFVFPPNRGAVGNAQAALKKAKDELVALDARIPSDVTVTAAAQQSVDDSSTVSDDADEVISTDGSASGVEEDKTDRRSPTIDDLSSIGSITPNRRDDEHVFPLDPPLEESPVAMHSTVDSPVEEVDGAELPLPGIDAEYEAALAALKKAYSTLVETEGRVSRAETDKIMENVISGAPVQDIDPELKNILSAAKTNHKKAQVRFAAASDAASAARDVAASTARVFPPESPINVESILSEEPPLFLMDQVDVTATPEAAAATTAASTGQASGEEDEETATQAASAAPLEDISERDGIDPNNPPEISAEALEIAEAAEAAAAKAAEDDRPAPAIPSERDAETAASPPAAAAASHIAAPDTPAEVSEPETPAAATTAGVNVPLEDLLGLDEFGPPGVKPPEVLTHEQEVILRDLTDVFQVRDVAAPAATAAAAPEVLNPEEEAILRVFNTEDSQEVPRALSDLFEAQDLAEAKQSADKIAALRGDDAAADYFDGILPENDLDAPAAPAAAAGAPAVSAADSTVRAEVAAAPTEDISDLPLQQDGIDPTVPPKISAEALETAEAAEADAAAAAAAAAEDDRPAPAVPSEGEDEEFGNHQDFQLESNSAVAPAPEDAAAASAAAPVAPVAPSAAAATDNAQLGDLLALDQPQAVKPPLGVNPDLEGLFSNPTGAVFVSPPEEMPGAAASTAMVAPSEGAAAKSQARAEDLVASGIPSATAAVAAAAKAAAAKAAPGAPPAPPVTPAVPHIMRVKSTFLGYEFNSELLKNGAKGTTPQLGGTSSVSVSTASADEKIKFKGVNLEKNDIIQTTVKFDNVAGILQKTPDGVVRDMTDPKLLSPTEASVLALEQARQALEDYEPSRDGELKVSGGTKEQASRVYAALLLLTNGKANIKVTPSDLQVKKGQEEKFIRSNLDSKVVDQARLTKMPKFGGKMTESEVKAVKDKIQKEGDEYELRPPPRP